MAVGLGYDKALAPGSGFGYTCALVVSSGQEVGDFGCYVVHRKWRLCD